MDLSRVTTISFDCYGTLIDWESGILPVLRRLLSENNQHLSDAAILELFAEFEALAETGPYRRYRDVLRSVVRSFGDRFKFRPTSAELNSLHESVEHWFPFADTVQALRELKKRYKLAVISNIDDDLFAETRKLLKVEFDVVITAQQAGSYKPSVNNFRIALGALSISPEQLLHAAQSVYHDVVPARSLGISTAWVNRKSARPGIGAVRASNAPALEQRADLEVADLANLAASL
jgi:2-haloacid dehalogenase